jgi:phosphatidylglycerol:prolipoprotein diacylglycerol transferase
MRRSPGRSSSPCWRFRDRISPHRLFGLYLLLSGSGRFLVEFIRRNDEVVLGLTQPQLFAAAFLAPKRSPQ